SRCIDAQRRLIGALREFSTNSPIIEVRSRKKLHGYCQPRATFEPSVYSNPDRKFVAGGRETIGKRESGMRVLSVIGGLAIAVGIACAVYFFGGYYSVAGTAEDPAAVTWALTRVRTASIERHARDAPPASLGDPRTVQAGAKAYAAFGCV